MPRILPTLGNSTKWETTTQHTLTNWHIFLISVSLNNVMDKKHSDDQINTSRLFSSNNERLPMLTVVSSPTRKAVCKVVAA